MSKESTLIKYLLTQSIQQVKSQLGQDVFFRFFVKELTHTQHSSLLLLVIIFIIDNSLSEFNLMKKDNYIAPRIVNN